MEFGVVKLLHSLLGKTILTLWREGERERGREGERRERKREGGRRKEEERTEVERLRKEAEERKGGRKHRLFISAFPF